MRLLNPLMLILLTASHRGLLGRLPGLMLDETLSSPLGAATMQLKMTRSLDETPLPLKGVKEHRRHHHRQGPDD